MSIDIYPVSVFDSVIEMVKKTVYGFDDRRIQGVCIFYTLHHLLRDNVTVTNHIPSRYQL